MEQATQLSPMEAEGMGAWLAEHFAYRLREALGSRAGVWELTRRTRPPVVLWHDREGCLNNAQLVTYLSPTVQYPERPLVLRAAINFFAVPEREVLPTHIGAADAGAQRPHWSLELSAFPVEMNDLIPWIADFAAAQAARNPGLLSEPPHPLRCRPDFSLDCNYAWTWTAWRAVEQAMQRVGVGACAPSRSRSRRP
ncbi:MAG: hypothetical protein ACE149_14810 [Armatimonadota bacterium]